MFQIIDLILGFIHSTVVPCKLFVITIGVSFISDCIFFYAAEVLTKFLECILITSVLNSASDRLSPFCLALCLEFGPCFFVASFWQLPCVCFYV